MKSPRQRASSGLAAAEMARVTRRSTGCADVRAIAGVLSPASSAARARSSRTRPYSADADQRVHPVACPTATASSSGVRRSSRATAMDARGRNARASAVPRLHLRSGSTARAMRPQRVSARSPCAFRACRCRQRRFRPTRPDRGTSKRGRAASSFTERGEGRDDEVPRRGRAHRRRRAAPRSRPLAPLPPLMLPTLPRGKGETKNLGTQEFDGVKADGTQTTHTIPAGEIGNEKPIVDHERALVLARVTTSSSTRSRAIRVPATRSTVSRTSSAASRPPTCSRSRPTTRPKVSRR